MSFVIAQIYDALLAPAQRLGLAGWRHDLVSALRGSVLEIGSGTGRNLEHYDAALEHLILAEPDHHMRVRLARRLRALPIASRVEICDAPAEQLRFGNASFDTVVSTFVLCSVTNPEQSIREACRVLRPGGQFLLIEHILAPVGTRRRRWQQRLNPTWSRFSNGCRLDRDPRPALLEAGFQEQSFAIDELRGAPGFLRTVLRGTWRKPE